MEDPKKSYHFASLGSAEKKELLRQFVIKKGSAVLWPKGGEHKEEYTAKTNIGDALVLEKNIDSPSYLVNKKVMVKLDIMGRQFFSVGTLSQNEEGGFFSITLGDDVYKCERRRAFRLRTYSSNDFKIDLKFDFEDDDKTKERVYKSFVNLVENDLFIKLEKNEPIAYKIRDISISGLSIWVSQNEIFLFEKNKVFAGINVYINGKSWELPKARVVYAISVPDDYKRDMKHAENRGEIIDEKYDVKVAFEYIEINEDLQDQIQKEINEEMRNIGKEISFELFIG